MNNKVNKFLFNYILLPLIIINLVIAILFGMYKVLDFYYNCSVRKSPEYKLELQPINGNTYCIYQDVHSNIPSENYQTVVFKSGNKIYNLNGHINFYDDVNDEFYATWKNTKYVHEDIINIHVNSDAIVFKQPVYVV